MVTSMKDIPALTAEQEKELVENPNSDFKWIKFANTHKEKSLKAKNEYETKVASGEATTEDIYLFRKFANEQIEAITAYNYFLR